MRPLTDQLRHAAQEGSIRMGGLADAAPQRSDKSGRSRPRWSSSRCVSTMSERSGALPTHGATGTGCHSPQPRGTARSVYSQIFRFREVPRKIGRRFRRGIMPPILLWKRPLPDLSESWSSAWHRFFRPFATGRPLSEREGSDQRGGVEPNQLHRWAPHATSDRNACWVGRLLIGLLRFVRTRNSGLIRNGRLIRIA
jgi:hypothetical protein